jgi:hypothetical protein
LSYCIRTSCKELGFPWRSVHDCSGRTVFELVSDDDDDVEQQQGVRRVSTTYLEDREPGGSNSTLVGDNVHLQQHKRQAHQLVAQQRPQLSRFELQQAKLRATSPTCQQHQQHEQQSSGRLDQQQHHAAGIWKSASSTPAHPLEVQSRQFQICYREDKSPVSRNAVSDQSDTVATRRSQQLAALRARGLCSPTATSPPTSPESAARRRSRPVNEQQQQSEREQRVSSE